MLRLVIDLHDLVHEVWAIALPRLGALREREGLDGPVLVAFLARILLYRGNDLVREHVVGKPRQAGSSAGMLARLPGHRSGAVTRAVRRGTRDAVRDATEQLGEADREVVILRGIERSPVHQSSAVMGLGENLVSVRYRRALDELRGLLSGEIVAPFAES